MKVRRLAGTVVLFLAFVAAIPVALSSTQRMDTVFRSANRAYFEGDTRQAIELYGVLLEAGVRDPDVYFNLGVSYARAGQYGRAILHFERAARLRPSDRGAQEGAAMARAALVERDATPVSDILDAGSDGLGAVVRPISEPFLAIGLLAANAILFGSLLLRRVVRAEPLRLALGVSASLAIVVLTGMAAGLSAKRELFEEGRLGIVTSREASILEGPHPSAGSRGRAREGERARLFERDESYVRVELDGGRQGWMAQSSVEAL